MWQPEVIVDPNKITFHSKKDDEVSAWLVQRLLIRACYAHIKKGLQKYHGGSCKLQKCFFQLKMDTFSPPHSPQDLTFCTDFLLALPCTHVLVCSGV